MSMATLRRRRKFKKAVLLDKIHKNWFVHLPFNMLPSEHRKAEKIRRVNLEKLAQKIQKKAKLKIKNNFSGEKRRHV